MKTMLAVLAFAVSLSASADPVQFDVGDAHVVVVRPIDAWSPDASLAEKSLKFIDDKGFAYSYIDAAGKKISPFPGSWIAAKVVTPVSEEVSAQLAGAGFKEYRSSPLYEIGAPVNVEVQKLPALLALQNELYRKWSLRQGDPSELESKVKTKKIIGSTVGLLIGVAGVKTFGTSVDPTNYVNLTGDINRVAGASARAVMPLPLPDLDFSTCKEVDIRRVDRFGYIGEIIICYRTPKTESLEQSALAKAIITASGISASVQEIQAARTADYQRRVAFWTAAQQKGEIAAPEAVGAGADR